MPMQTTIKISKEFKKEISQKKKTGETFEDTFKRLIQGVLEDPDGPTNLRIPEGSIPLSEDEALEVIRQGKTITVQDGKNYQRVS